MEPETNYKITFSYITFRSNNKDLEFSIFYEYINCELMSAHWTQVCCDWVSHQWKELGIP
jgi:hypothetical protein